MKAFKRENEERLFSVKNVGKNVRKNKKEKNTKAWFLLSIAFAFMLSVFAPIEAYYTNKNEFWFNIGNVLEIALIVFIILTAVLITVSCILCNLKTSVYYYTFLTFLMIYLYIQGNYIPRNYGVLNGADINWDQYKNYSIASVTLALVCLALCVSVILKLKKRAFMIGSYISIFIFSVQVITLLTFAIRDIINLPNNSNKSKIVTDNKAFSLSEKNNIIIFILDTFDGEFLNHLLDEDYVTYSEILKDFTYYKDTLGAYPTTKGALPYILTGVWYENEQPYVDYVENAYVDNSIYKSLKENDYSVGIYTSGSYLSSDDDIYENVELGTYKISNKLDFTNQLYRMVAFNYSPHQWKQYFFFDSTAFEAYKESAVEHEAYSSDLLRFEKRLSREGITISEVRNCLRLYHLNGVHGPYTFGKDLTSDVNTKYSCYDVAAGNCKLLKEYFNELKDKGIYDDTTIVIMADHGAIEYSQNPIFLIKNKGENHEFIISDVPMSFEYLPNILTTLISESKVNENFINNCAGKRKERRFLYYSWDDKWDREYLPTILEMLAKGAANNVTNIIFSGMQYEPALQDYSYTLGKELSFMGESPGKIYCISGFSWSEESGTWTNGTQSTMAFDIKKEEYNNLLMTIESGIYGSQKEVILYVNDHQVADIKFNNLERKEIVIPNEYIKDGLIRITMKYPDVTVPHDIDEKSVDYRQLALKIRTLKLESTDRVFDLNAQMAGGYKLGSELTFAYENNTAKDYCISGFSGAEEAYTWTDSDTANMDFLILNEDVGDMVLEYTCAPFNGKQRVILYANDQRIDDYNQTIEETKKIYIPKEIIKSNKLSLRFELPDAISPKDLGMSEDARTLGLAMKKLTINAVDFEANEYLIGSYKLGTELTFSYTDNGAKDYCVSGFSVAEETFTWTDSNTANMSFLLLNEKLGDMVLEFTCFPFNGKQHVILYANDQKIDDYNQIIEETKKIYIPKEIIKNNKLSLRFELPDAKSPQELGMSEDARTLGLAMEKLVINAVD